jgi:hypothetical protein
MKRKYESTFGKSEMANPSMYGAPPLESTMLISVGGIETKNDCIGNLSTIPVSANMSGGTRLFQYNRFYWNKDLFTFNFNNCAIMIILSWYNGVEQLALTMLMGVFLPQTALTLYQSLQSGATFDPTVKTKMINDLLFYLNGMWAGNPVGDNPPYFKTPPSSGGFQFGPCFFTYHYKGFLFQPTNHYDFPFFQQGNNPPPLKWISIGSNQNICLIKNPDYWFPDGVPRTDVDCAFQLVNPYVGFTLSAGNPNNIVCYPDNLTARLAGQYGTIQSSYRNAGNPNHKGWCGRGAFNIGFAQADDEHVFGAYTDVYGEFSSPILQDLWVNYTTFVGQELGVKLTGIQWQNFVENHFLSRYCIIAYFLPNFLPSRYLTVTSEILGRNQKLMVLSNSPLLSQPNIIGIQFLTTDAIRTWQDTTLSGILPSNTTSSAFSGRANGGGNDTPVINMNPFNSIQSIDISMFDEWGSNIQNFRSSHNSYVLQFVPTYNAGIFGLGLLESGNYVCSYTMGENSFILDNSGGYTANISTFPIPTWLQNENPLNAVSVPPPSQQPIMAPFSTYNSTSLYMLYAFSSFLSYAGSHTVSVPLDFSPSMPYSATMIHFGRVLGY